MPHTDPLLLRQLSLNSRGYHDPLTRLDWSLLNTTDFWLPPVVLSLHGQPEFEALPETQRKRLSHFEFLHFIQAGLWLESIFLQRLSQQLQHLRDRTEHAYYLHEIREEAGHSLMFLQLMEQSGLHLPASLCRQPHWISLAGRHAPLNSALFWLAVVLGEEIPDKLNRQVRLVEENAVNPLIRQMCSLHLMDEARHIAHARAELAAQLKGCGGIRAFLLARTAQVLLGQFVRRVYLPEAGIYELAGLAPGNKWRELARHNPQRLQFVARCVEPTLNQLRGLGIRLELPRL